MVAYLKMNIKKPDSSQSSVDSKVICHILLAASLNFRGLINFKNN